VCTKEQHCAAVRATLTLSPRSVGGPSSGRRPYTSDERSSNLMPTALTHPVNRDAVTNVLRSDGIVSEPSRRPPRPVGMKSGDVLVSRPTARADVYDVSVVPALARMSGVRYEDGTEIGRQLAQQLAVDGWFTCDHTHVVRIAKYRK
jgi:hypothetical protein